MKIILEVPPKGKYSNIKANIRGKISSTINILTSSALSTIIYVPMPKSETYSISRDPNEVNTFLPGLVYQLLILLEHVIIIGITTSKASEMYGYYSNVLLFAPLVLWLVNLVLLIIYYKLLHRSKNLETIGPKRNGCNLEHHAVVCFRLKHFYLNCKTCYCSVEDVDQNHECSRVHDNNPILPKNNVETDFVDFIMEL